MKRLSLLLTFIFGALTIKAQDAQMYCDYAKHCSGTGQLSEAVNYYEKALELCEDQVEKIYILHNITDTYTSLGNFRKAQEFLDFAEENAKGLENNTQVKSMLNLSRAFLASGLGDNHLAEKYYLDELKGDNSIEEPEYRGKIQRNLSDIYLKLGKYSLAQEMAIKSLMGARNPIDSIYSIRASSLAAALKNDIGDKDFAISRLKEAERLVSSRLKNNLYEKGKQQLFNANIYELCENYPFAVKLYEKAYSYLSDILSEGHPEAISALYGLAKMLMMTGRSAEGLEKFSLYVQRKLTYLNENIVGLPPEDARNFWECYNEGIDDSPIICEWAEQMSDKAASIALNLVMLSKSVGYDVKSGINESKWDNISKHLNDNSVAVEFAQYRRGRQKYICAFTYSNKSKYPHMVILSSKSDIESTDKTDLNGLYEKIWEPLEATISGYDTVFFSPAGILHKLPMEYLCDKSGVSLYQKFEQVVRVTLSRDIPTVKSGGFSQAIVYGCIDYLNNGSDRSIRNQFSPLPYSAKEIITIKKHLRSIVPVTIKSGNNAQEYDLKSLELNKSDSVILHFSTHGFYLGAEQARDVGYYDKFSTHELYRHPMTRCGLALSGANVAWRGEQRPDANDGILTAQEVSQMDLKGVKLASLAACQTGLGDIWKDGVNGLVRGFRLSGVKQLLVSLWATNDKSSMLLMDYFYDELSKGKDSHQALKTAVDTLRSIPEFSAPEHWAAYVIVD